MAEVVDDYVSEEKAHADLLHQVVKPQYPMDINGSGNIDDDYVEISRMGVNEFVQLRHSQLPKKIREQINRMQTNCNFGMFPALSRAWVTVDSNLFLWNFETNKDLAYYDAITKTITKVELANVKPGMFEPAVKFILVIITVEEIVLLAVSFVSEHEGIVNLHSGYDDPNVYLVMQEIHTMPLDGSVVEQICCTSDGRIFFSCEDTLHELNYYYDIWNSRVFKRVNLTKSFIHNLISVFGTRDKIRQIACDESRHILYTLSTSSKITVYDLGDRGQTFTYVADMSIHTLQKEIGNRFSIDYELLKEVIYVSVIPSTQSMYVNLVATMKSGYRAYFTCAQEIFMERANSRFSQHHVRPLCLRLIHFRYSPMPISNFLNSNLTTYYTKIIDDITIVAFGSSANSTSTVYALSTANFPYTSRFQESKDLLPISQSIWSIESQTAVYERETVIQTRDNIELELVPSPQPRAFARQHVTPTTLFHVITAESINTFAHLKPVELFRRILENFGPDSRQINSFMSLHGAMELCVMALILLSSDEIIDTSLKEMALRVFVTHGGHPTLVINAEDNYTHGSNAGTTAHFSPDRCRGEMSPSTMQRQPLFSSTPSRQPSSALGDASVSSLNQSMLPPVNQQTLADISHISFTTHGQPAIDGFRLRPSNRSRAIFTFFARIVYPIWRKRICYLKDNTYITGIRLNEVREVLRHVCGLHRVIEAYALFTGAYYGGEKNSTHVVEAVKQEKNSVKMLSDLMVITKEYLALWQIILENNFHATISNVQTDLRTQLQSFCFAELVALSEVNGLELISALVHYYLGDEARTAAINERLGNECPRLFTNDDANVLKATELVYNAKKASSLKERQQLVSQAITILKRHAKRVNLFEIATLLKQINYFTGIADLALSCAAAVDPRGLALTAHYRKTPEADDEETRQAIQHRAEIYNLLIDVITYLHQLSGADENSSPLHDASLSPAAAEIERDRLIDFVLENNDELLHVFLFRFLMDKHLEGLLIRKKNPLFERFICREIENGSSDTRFFDLLWRYYKDTEDFAKAARLLYELATKRKHTASMDKKMEFLSQALICINSAPESPQSLELRQKIRDWLDVALVQQKTRSTLRESPANTFDIDVLNETLRLLDENLLTLGDLLQIATKFELPEVKAAIYKCAGMEQEGKF